MYFQWWIILLGALMIAGYSAIYFLEWKHPLYKLAHINHSYTLWLKGIVNIVASVVTAWLMAAYLVFVSSYFSGLFAIATTNIWVQRIASFLFLDAIMYWWHRINHTFPALWKFHELHHEEKELNVYSTFHFHPKELAISTGWRIILFPLMGINPAALLMYEAVFFTIILFHHSNFRLSYFWDKLFSTVIVTPGLHHLHHSVKIEESNSNYGSVFSFWDRIFRSRTIFTTQPVKYGLK